MRLKDIADMEDYLENRCYCPYEIYDLSGFFFQLFRPNTECKLLAEGDRGAIHGTFVLAQSCACPMQIIYIEQNDGVVESCIRFDATENNKRMVTDFLGRRIDKMTIDKYSDNHTDKELEEILSMADAVLMS